MKLPLQILSDALLPNFLKQIESGLESSFYALKEAEISTADFSFYTSVAAVYSSKIESEDIELDSYIKHKHLGISFLPDYTKKTDDLYSAYIFAQQNQLTEASLLEAHQLLGKHLLLPKYLGKYRSANMFVTTPEGQIAYVATVPNMVGSEMQKLFEDISLLQSTTLSLAESFYYAAYIHLVFVKIHPFADGNGRTARLIEKWFLAEKLGTKAWFLQSEKQYYNAHQAYYENLGDIGLEYPNLVYEKALPFLLMAVQSLK